MSTRRYDQFCGLAQALDLMGDRWTALVVRELVGGARRFSDLRAGLPAIPEATLSRALKRLVEQGQVERARLSENVDVTVYRLTDDGHALAEALAPLAAWGAKHLGMVPRDKHLRASWVPIALHAAFDPEQASDCVIDYNLGGQRLHAVVEDGRLTVTDGPAPVAANIRCESSLEDFIAAGVGQRRPGSTLKFTASKAALRAYGAMFSRLRPRSR